MAMPLVGTTKGYLGSGVGQGSPGKRRPTELSAGCLQHGKVQQTGFSVEAFCFPTEALAVPRSPDALEVKIQPRFAHHSASEHLGFTYGHCSVCSKMPLKFHLGRHTVVLLYFKCKFHGMRTNASLTSLLI